MEDRREYPMLSYFVGNETIVLILVVLPSSSWVKVTAGQIKGVATVKCDCSSVGEVIADSVLALIMHVQSSLCPFD